MGAPPRHLHAPPHSPTPSGVPSTSDLRPQLATDEWTTGSSPAPAREELHRPSPASSSSTIGYAASGRLPRSPPWVVFRGVVRSWPIEDRSLCTMLRAGSYTSCSYDHRPSSISASVFLPFHINLPCCSYFSLVAFLYLLSGRKLDE